MRAVGLTYGLLNCKVKTKRIQIHDYASSEALKAEIRNTISRCTTLGWELIQMDSYGPFLILKFKLKCELENLLNEGSVANEGVYN